MRLDETAYTEQILNDATELNANMAEYIAMCERADRMWRLEAFSRNDQRDYDDQLNKKTRVVRMQPYNVTMLIRRLLGGEINIEVLTDREDDEAKRLAELREMWAQGFLYRLQREQRINLRADLSWWGAVRGRFAIDVRWIREQQTDRERKSRLPFLVRTLEPMNVLVRWSWNTPLYIIHEYATTVADVRNRYRDEGERVTDGKAEKDTVTIRDYWDEEQNCVLCGNEVLVEPWEHEYGQIPIIISGADSTPVQAEEYRWRGMLEPWYESWMMQCRTATLGTVAAQNEMWGAVVVYDPNDSLGGKLDRTPGGFNIINAPKGDSGVDVISTKPNMQLLELINNVVGTDITQATFPGMLYGQEPGSDLAGFAIANLSSSAKGRIGLLRENMELAIADMFGLVFNLTHQFGGSEGVSVWAAKDGMERDPRKAGGRYLTLRKDDLRDDMPIIVRIATDLPQDDMANKTIAMQARDKGILSTETLQTDYFGIKYPERERQRILKDKAYENPQLQQAQIEEAYFEQTGRRLQDVLGGTRNGGGVPAGDGGGRGAPAMAPVPAGAGGGPGAGLAPMMPPPGMGQPMGQPASPSGAITPQQMGGLPPQLMPPQMGAPVPPQPPPNIPPQIWAAMRGLPMGMPR